MNYLGNQKFRFDFSYTDALETAPLFSTWHGSITNWSDPDAEGEGGGYCQKIIIYKKNDRYYRMVLELEQDLTGDYPTKAMIDIVYNDSEDYDTVDHASTLAMYMNWLADIASDGSISNVTVLDSDPDEDTAIDDYQKLSRDTSSSISEPRFEGVDEGDLVWKYDETAGIWMWHAAEDATDVLARGGGRYGQRLIAVGHNSVYFGTL